MQKKLLSVVVSAYNLEDYIEECVKSIQNQTYKNLEIIIIDDGSADRTGAICQELQKTDDRIIYVYQDNEGITSARVKGAEIATGQYITFVDGDDYINTRMYEKMVPLMLNYDMITCGIIKQSSYGDEQLLKDAYSGGYTSEFMMEAIWKNMLYDFENEKLHNLYPSLANKLFKKELLLPILQKVDRDINYGEDAVVTLQYALLCDSIMFLDEAFYFYRYRETSVTRSLNTKMMESSVRIYDLLKPVFTNHDMSVELNKQLEKWMIYLMIHSVNKYMGFSQENRIPQFWIGLDDFIDKNIVIYGAGQMGQDIMWSCKKMGQEIMAWVDRDYLLYQKDGMDVSCIDILENDEFIKDVDVILIAVSNENIADKIKQNLMQMKINKEKIIWKKPVRVY